MSKVRCLIHSGSVVVGLSTVTSQTLHSSSDHRQGKPHCVVNTQREWRSPSIVAGNPLLSLSPPGLSSREVSDHHGPGGHLWHPAGPQVQRPQVLPGAQSLPGEAAQYTGDQCRLQYALHPQPAEAQEEEQVGGQDQLDTPGSCE